MTKDRRAKHDARAESQRTDQPYTRVRRQDREQQHRDAMPPHVRQMLLDTFNTHEAHLLVHGWSRTGRHPGFLHPGDPLGRIVAWLWGEDPQYTVQFLGEWLAMVRRGVDDHEITPTVTVEDLMRGLRLCLPPSFGDEQREALTARARRELPELLAYMESSP